jgi:hypothetical protein
MVINASKTEAAYFLQRELPNPPSVNIVGIQIELKKTINVALLLTTSFIGMYKWKKS